MATGKVVGKIEVASIGNSKIVDVDGGMRDATYEGLLYEGEQIVSNDPETLFQIRYFALPEATVYEGVFGVLADGSVIADVSALEALFGDDIDFMETAAGDGEPDANSGIPEDAGIFADSVGVQGFHRGENGEVGLGGTYDGDGSGRDNTEAVDTLNTTAGTINPISIDEINSAPVASAESVTKIADFIPADDGIVYSLNGQNTGVGLTVTAYAGNVETGVSDVDTNGHGAWGVLSPDDDSNTIEGGGSGDPKETIVFTFTDSFTSAVINLTGFSTNDQLIWKAFDGSDQVLATTTITTLDNNTFEITLSSDFTTIDRIEISGAGIDTEFYVHSITTDSAAINTMLPFVIDDTMLLANDIDIDGDALHIELVDGVLLAADGSTVGSVVLNADGDIQVTPDAEYIVDDNSAVTFSYIVVDEHGAESEAVSATVDMEVGTVATTEVSYDQTTGEFIIGTDVNTEGALIENVLTVEDTLDLSNVSDINTIELDGDATVTGSSDLGHIIASDVLDATDVDNILVIQSADGVATDQVEVHESFGDATEILNDGQWYAEYSSDGATLLIEIDTPTDAV